MISKIENPILRGIAEWAITIAFAVLLFLLIRNFGFRIAHVDGSSMTPTLEHGDTVVLNRFVYVFGTPRAGDIVAFPYPDNPEKHYIKRIIAVPGDTVDFVDGFFWVNDELLADEFSQDPAFALGDVVFPLVVEDGRYFVLGDNRNGSQDSRFSSVGTIPASSMIGRASTRIWPLGRFGRVG